MGAFLIGTVVWGAKYFSENGGTDLSHFSNDTTNKYDSSLPAEENDDSESIKPVDDTTSSPLGDDIKPPSLGDNMKPPPSEDKIKPSPPGDDMIPTSVLKTTKKPPKTKTTTTKKIRKDRSGYVGNGWWSSNLYHGWEPSLYPGASWGTGVKPPKSPFDASSFFSIDKLPSLLDIEESANYLKNITDALGLGIGGHLDKTGDNLFDNRVTTTTEPMDEEHVSEYGEIVVTVPKDHLKPPSGGWGVDYNPYFYYNG